MTQKATDADLLGHWPLAAGAEDVSGNKLHGEARNVVFGKDGATFNGKDSVIEVGGDGSRPGKGDFSLAAWIHTDRESTDSIGDIVSCFNADSRTGFMLTVKGNPGGSSHVPNRRHLQFAEDSGTEPVWSFCGRPGSSRMIFGLTVHEGGLYAATHETEKDQRGHVFRYESGENWADCGAPDAHNSVYSLLSFNGDLYAGTACDNMEGSLQPLARNLLPGGGVFRYRGGTDWEDCGNPFNDRTMLAVLQGAMFARSVYHPHFYRFEGPKQWRRLDTPNVGFWGCAEFQGDLYAAPKKLKPSIYPNAQHPDPYPSIWRYSPDAGWQGSDRGMTGQVYAFTLYRGELIAGTWPKGKIFRSPTGGDWTDAGACGLGPIQGPIKGEIMGMAPYHGKLYVGTLPLAEVYRYDGDDRWTLMKRLDFTPDAPIRRAWSMAEYGGRLYVGTLPGGEVHCMQAGRGVAYDHELPTGWQHVAAVRHTDRLSLYLNGTRVADSASAPLEHPAPRAPVQIGFGPHNYFHGSLRDVRVYGRALAADEIAGLAVE